MPEAGQQELLPGLRFFCFFRDCLVLRFAQSVITMPS